MIRNLLVTLGLQMAPPSTAKRAPATPEKTVLIIDNDVDSLRAMSATLGETYRLETAATGESALRKLSSFYPDLILLDLRVFAAEGTRLASRLLADEELAPVPIVALAAMGKPRHDHLPSHCRFDGYLEKPINPDTFPGQVRAFLERSWQAPNHSTGLALPGDQTGDRRKHALEVLDAIAAGLPDSQFAPSTQSELHDLATAVGSLQHLEVSGLVLRAEKLSGAATARARGRFRSLIVHCRDLVQRDPDELPGLADLRAGYIENRVAELHALEQALKNGDFAAFRKVGHNLKGTGMQYGFAELTALGRALEAAAKENDSASIEILLDRIDAYIAIVRLSPED